jgi:hypothetical protein
MKDIVDNFSQIAGSVDQLILVYSEEILNLGLMRETLLPKLLSGEIKISAE